MRLPLALIALLVLPAPALAVGGEDDSPPVPTQTTTECADGEIWDEDAEECVTIEDASLDDDALYRAARELAYAERYDDAIAALGRMSDASESRVQTYLGFANRKAGRVDEGMAHYQAALDADPDNLLARSYMGMAYLEAGETEMAQAQLVEIRARGGAGGWPERALDTALTTGSGYSY